MKVLPHCLVVLAVVSLGCVSTRSRPLSWDPDTQTKNLALQTCRRWVPVNLDLGDFQLADYHHSISGLYDYRGKPIVVVFFAHKVEGKRLIRENGSIHPIRGGFPGYFNVRVSADGKSVLSHYADRY